MIRRTTVEIDDELLARAKRALGVTTTRSAIETALRQAADTAERLRDERAARQRAYMAGAAERLDLDVLGSEQMWQ